ncbi:MAG: helix-turn-helix domain-containing protein [Deltaproteobacteria bacterium]|uniref:Helix-turn-helix domain-containing protein n=1 Tax=Candidatus Desulfacyla euxinica TaxID=2841693 RepID=A0A8J6TAF0_9DELT|nr:helix-turn-helix domain-containing protein [Candidatus Desulfacyla euxinica]MBL7218394.1 helix-turn-helix domain-containing protein [Desulfobacteraceae bacterium]
MAREITARISASMVPGRWLTMKEAKEYAKVRSINTIKKWVNEGLIYGRPRSGRGDWIVDRESIDRFYLEDEIRVERR